MDNKQWRAVIKTISIAASCITAQVSDTRDDAIRNIAGHIKFIALVNTPPSPRRRRGEGGGGVEGCR